MNKSFNYPGTARRPPKIGGDSALNSTNCISADHVAALRYAIDQHFEDERLYATRTDANLQRWRLCVSPRIAALMAFYSLMSFKFSTQAELDTIQVGTTEQHVTWVRFPASPGLDKFEEVEVSPAHFGFSLVLID